MIAHRLGLSVRRRVEHRWRGTRGPAGPIACASMKRPMPGRLPRRSGVARSTAEKVLHAPSALRRAQTDTTRGLLLAYEARLETAFRSGPGSRSSAAPEGTAALRRARQSFERVLRDLRPFGVLIERVARDVGVQSSPDRWIRDLERRTAAWAK